MRKPREGAPPRPDAEFRRVAADERQAQDPATGIPTASEHASQRRTSSACETPHGLTLAVFFRQALCHAANSLHAKGEMRKGFSASALSRPEQGLGRPHASQLGLFPLRVLAFRKARLGEPHPGFTGCGCSASRAEHEAGPEEKRAGFHARSMHRARAPPCGWPSQRSLCLFARR